MAEGGEVHFRTPDGETSFRIAGDKAELRAKRLKSLSDKREYRPRIRDMQVESQTFCSHAVLAAI